MVEDYNLHPRTIHIANNTAEVEGNTLKLIWNNEMVVGVFDPTNPYGTLLIVNKLQPYVHDAIQYWWKKAFMFEEDFND